MTWTRTSGARNGSIIAATWLIGLGIVFLVQRAADLSWSQAWPLFVILAGVASFVSTGFGSRSGIAGIWAYTWPVVTILVGGLLLASTTGNLGRGPGELIEEYWPVGVIVLGVWYLIGAFVPGRPAVQETLTIPLGGVSEGAVRIRFGAGELTTRVAAAGQLIDGHFEGGVRSRASGPGRVELEQDTSHGIPWFDHRSVWELGLSAEVPLDLRLDTGASRATVDARHLRLRSLELRTGASETRVMLPRAAGATTVKAEAGAASLTFEVPPGVAARIRSRMGLGSSQVDEARFRPVGGGYESDDYATAANRVDIDVQGGVGSVRIVSGG